MRRAMVVGVLLAAAAAARAGERSCGEIEESTRRACQASARGERRGPEQRSFDEDLCRTAAEVARRACDHGVHAERYRASCTREAEYVSDVMAEACRRVLYRNPRSFVKVWFRTYDERCRRASRAAEEAARKDSCAPPQDGRAAPPVRR